MFDSLFDFAKDMGKKLFQSDADAAESILAHINSNNPGVDPLTVEFDDGVVTMAGAAINQPAKEKAVLMAGNVKGVEKVQADAVSVPRIQRFLRAAGRRHACWLDPAVPAACRQRGVMPA